MPWKQLYILAEGDTETNFIKRCLADHLAGFEIATYPVQITTSRALDVRGGNISYQKAKNELCRVMGGRGNDCRFSMMIDFYRLPNDFPGYNQISQKPTPIAKVEFLESQLKADITDSRFIPHIQLHEFEALLFCGLPILKEYLRCTDREMTALSQNVGNLKPEEINQGPATAPSKRICARFPVYEKAKVRIAAGCANQIGLPILRQKCPHFHQWISALEAISI